MFLKPKAIKQAVVPKKKICSSDEKDDTQELVDVSSMHTKLEKELGSKRRTRYEASMKYE